MAHPERPIDERLDLYISVDIETAGPNPSDYAMLAVGACRVDRPEESFYVELRPDRALVDAEALAISGLDFQRLLREGTAPEQAMRDFESWLEEQASAGEWPVFVAFNAPFDWMFVADYFHRYLRHNPFGHSALDVKALFMGAFGVPWNQTTMAQVAERLGLPSRLSHHALEDARQQAEIFRTIMSTTRQWPEERARDG